MWWYTWNPFISFPLTNETTIHLLDNSLWKFKSGLLGCITRRGRRRGAKATQNVRAIYELYKLWHFPSPSSYLGNRIKPVLGNSWMHMHHPLGNSVQIHVLERRKQTNSFAQIYIAIVLMSWLLCWQVKHVMELLHESGPFKEGIVWASWLLFPSWLSLR